MDILGDNPKHKAFRSSSTQKKRKKKEQGAKFCFNNQHSQQGKKYEGASATKHKENLNAHSNIPKAGTVI